MIKRAVVCAGLLSACSFDLTALRGHDAGADRVTPDVVTIDTPTIDTPEVVDVPLIDRPTRPPNMGMCPAGRAVDLTTTEATGLSAMTDNTTADAGALTLPTGMALFNCSNVDTQMSPATRVYRYTVRQGSRLTATTNTGLCSDLDTRVFALRSCDGADGGPNVWGCADDLANVGELLCQSCTDAGATANCNTLKSTLDLDVVPGDVVFLAVNGFGNATGAFRLWVGENAGSLEPLLATPPTGIALVNRCPCQPTSRRLTAINFPGGSEGAMDTGIAPLSADSRILGARAFTGGMVSGVTAQLRFSDVRVNPDPSCTGTVLKGTFDLFVGNYLVTSFSLRTPLIAPTTVTVPFTSFTPVNIPAGNTRFQLNLRAVEPASCLTFEIDRNGPNVVTLYGP